MRLDGERARGMGCARLVGCGKVRQKMLKKVRGGGCALWGKDI